MGGRALAERPRTRQDSLREARLEQERQRLYREPATVRGQITRGADNAPAQGAEIFVRDNATQQELQRKELGPQGEFSIKLEKGRVYDIGAETGETFYAIKTLDLRKSLDTNIVLQLNLPDTLVLRINFPFDDYSHPYEFVIGDNGEQLPMSWQNSLDLVARSAKASLATLKEIVVIGHTDSMGTDEYNDRLGERRAAFIRDELVKRGVPRNMMRLVSRGRKQPIARRPDETDEIFRLRSRRAEFIKVFK
jgi:outer membrane protein OmpA-like peptidoglycan-associated protein